MQTIYKYKLEVTDSQTIKLPLGAKILTVALQDGEPHIWSMVDTNDKYNDVEILTFGTGQDISYHGLQYIGTYQLLSGDLVYHIFSKF